MISGLGRIERWKARARALKTEVHALLLAYRDPRVPLKAKIVAALVVAYAVSPIDLIPDFIPVLGYLDDLVILPLGIMLAVKMIPAEVMQACRVRAATALPEKRANAILGAAIVVVMWLIMIYVVGVFGHKLFFQQLLGMSG